VSAYLLEEFLIKNGLESHTIVYRNIEFLKSNRQQRLLKDLSELTGKEVRKVKINKVDYKLENALLEIFYRE
jgi:hypothetical protein